MKTNRYHQVLYLDNSTTNLEYAYNNQNIVASQNSCVGLNIEFARKNPVSFNLAILAYFTTQPIETQYCTEDNKTRIKIAYEYGLF